MREPAVVRTPWVQKMSLWAMGTPVSAPPLPAARARSAAAAAASAGSRVTEMKALRLPWARSMRASSAVTSSTLENFRARSPAASCVSVLPCRSLTCPSLDDLRNQVKPGRDLRRVQLVLLVAVGLGHQVRPQALRQPRKRVRHRGDVRGGGAVKGTDEVDNPRQCLLVHGNFSRGELQARQGGDACDLLACEAHGSGKDAWIE